MANDRFVAIRFLSDRRQEKREHAQWRMAELKQVPGDIFRERAAKQQWKAFAGKTHGEIFFTLQNFDLDQTEWRRFEGLITSNRKIIVYKRREMRACKRENRIRHAFRRNSQQITQALSENVNGRINRKSGNRSYAEQLNKVTSCYHFFWTPWNREILETPWKFGRPYLEGII